MAGKSTLLRTIGLNLVLAYAGAPVCARKLVLSRFRLCASLAIHDSLLNRKSKFLAEMDRLKQALQMPLEEGPVLFLITELASLPELCARNVHMGSKDDSDPLDFDYLVKPGVTSQSSALAIARLAGVNV